MSPQDAVVQEAKDLIAGLKGTVLSALEGSAVKKLENLDKMLNQTSVTYKESIDDALPPHRVREDTTTPQRVMLTQLPCHLPPVKWEPIEE